MHTLTKNEPTRSGFCSEHRNLMRTIGGERKCILCLREERAAAKVKNPALSIRKEHETDWFGEHYEDNVRSNSSGASRGKEQKQYRRVPVSKEERKKIESEILAGKINHEIAATIGRNDTVVARIRKKMEIGPSRGNKLGTETIRLIRKISRANPGISINMLSKEAGCSRGSAKTYRI